MFGRKQTHTLKYKKFFKNRADSSDSVEREIVAKYSRGNVALGRGMYVGSDAFEKKLEFAAKCDFKD